MIPRGGIIMKLFFILKIRAAGIYLLDSSERKEIFSLNPAIAKFAGDERRKARSRTYVLQVVDNAADPVKLVIPQGAEYEGKYEVATSLRQ